MAGGTDLVVEDGDVVGVRYKGTLDDGSVFDENPGVASPLTVMCSGHPRREPREGHVTCRLRLRFMDRHRARVRVRARIRVRTRVRVGVPDKRRH